MSGVNMSLGNRKLVVLGIPWDVDTDGLRSYMAQFGELDDVIVMKDRSTGRSRGFGYVTFQTAEDAEKVLAAQHSLNGRALELKVATPKEEMLKPTSKKVTRVFVARIPPHVTDEVFRTYFEKYGKITDAYMPKEQASKAHRGIGFVTYEDPDSVEKLMEQPHELGGSAIAVDKATPKEDTMKPWGKYPGYYNPFGVYTNSRMGFMPSFGQIGYDYPAEMGQSYPAEMGRQAPVWSASPGTPPGGNMPAAAVPTQGNMPAATQPIRGMGCKIFVGRLPPDCTADDLRHYFSNFGRLVDVYVPKDARKMSHRGFGFVTFAEEHVAERVAMRGHQINGVQIAVDRATPQDEAQPNSAQAAMPQATVTPPGSINVSGPNVNVLPGAGGPIRGTSSANTYGGLTFDYNTNQWVYDTSQQQRTTTTSRVDARYRPY